MNKNITDELIKEYYEEIIEGLILNGEYLNEKSAISLIRTILECGVDAHDFDKIEYICMKVIDIKNLRSDRTSFDYGSFAYSSNKTLIEEAIRLYNEKVDTFGDYEEEFFADKNIVKR